MPRIVGDRNRSPYILDPALAWAAGRRLDALFAPLAQVVRHEVTRATHRELNAMDDRRQLAAAARVASAANDE